MSRWCGGSTISTTKTATVRGTTRSGGCVRALKCPLDMWIYQEIVFETQPDVIVETSTAHGGGAWFLGDKCEPVWVTGSSRSSISADSG